MFDIENIEQKFRNVVDSSEECDSNRFYDHGYTQRIAPYDFVESFSVDVPDDINKVEKYISKDEIFKKYK